MTKWDELRVRQPLNIIRPRRPGLTMLVTFSEDVEASEYDRLTWLAERAVEVGIPMTEYRTARPGLDLNKVRTGLRPEYLVTYHFQYSEDDSSCDITVLPVEELQAWEKL